MDGVVGGEGGRSQARDTARRCAAFLAAIAIGGATGCHEPAAPVFSSRCAALPELPSSAIVELTRVFGGVDIDDAVSLVEHPTADRFYVVAKSGQVYTFTPDDDDPSLVVDIEDALHIAGEAGLLDLEIDPQRPQDVYLSYNPPGTTTTMTSRISRFTWRDDGLVLDRDSEDIVLEIDQPYTNHNGGDIGFGPDGMLYIGFGDGGSAGDPRGHGQDTDTILGAMLRIDVRDPTAAYGIPAGNPFADGGGAPEIFAWGFRNPWRWSFDVETGALWVGDVGQHRWEEVSRVEVGRNYGWGVKEGPQCIGVDTCAGDFVDPIAAYRNVGTASVVGGAVMRGGSIAALEGQYVFSDFYDGSLWAVPADAPVGTEPVLVGDDVGGVAGWLRARNGTLYGVRYGGGIVALGQREASPEPATPFPLALSETGCVDMDDPAALPEWVVPYEINLPFWSDGADKQRFVAVPPGSRGSVDGDGVVQWPRGTVLGKTFSRGGVPIETRLLVRHASRWVGYGYAWDEDGGDAHLVASEAIGADGWILPGLRGCPACHTGERSGPLGTTVAQLSRDVDGGDQLAFLAASGVIEPVAAATPPLPAIDDDTMPLELRARAYLEVNCAQCHREEGTGGRASLDLRRDVPLDATGLCREPQAGDLGIDGARIVAPGDPSRSVLLSRVGTTGDAQMPPLGRGQVDDAGLALLTAWVESLAACG